MTTLTFVPGHTIMHQVQHVHDPSEVIGVPVRFIGTTGAIHFENGIIGHAWKGTIRYHSATYPVMYGPPTLADNEAHPPLT